MIPSTGPERDFEQAKLLMQEYSFDLRGFEAGELVAIWQERLAAEPSWIRAAVLEALYLGRYKAFSVEQILQGWKRRGHPIRHFNSEFERVVLGPIDPTASKYAAMTSLSPSELLSPQTEHPQQATYIRHEPQAPETSVEAAQAEPSAEAPVMANEVTEESASIPGMQPQQAALFSQPEPIQQFKPESVASEFYQRLQAVAQPPE